MDPQRRFLLTLTASSLACVVVQALTGIPELVLYLTPLFLIAALLLCGHYVAEERIVERWSARRPRATRRAPARWTTGRETPVVSLLERSPLRRRGPPRVAALA